MTSVYNQQFQGRVLYNVPARFDGKSIYSDSSKKGESIRVAVLDSNNDGRFDIGRDEVFFLDKGELTRDSFESIATKEGLAQLSSKKDGVITLADMKKANLSVAVDRNRDGMMEIKTSSATQTLSKLWNGINEGPVTYNGKETASTYEKESAASGVFKRFDASLDTNSNTCEENYIFDKNAYDAFSKDTDKMRLMCGAGGIGGIAAFGIASSALSSGLITGSLPATAAALGGLAGLAVGGMLLVSALCIAKTRPDLPVEL